MGTPNMPNQLSLLYNGSSLQIRRYQVDTVLSVKQLLKHNQWSFISLRYKPSRQTNNYNNNNNNNQYQPGSTGGRDRSEGEENEEKEGNEEKQQEPHQLEVMDEKGRRLQVFENFVLIRQKVMWFTIGYGHGIGPDQYYWLRPGDAISCLMFFDKALSNEEMASIQHICKRRLGNCSSQSSTNGGNNAALVNGAAGRGRWWWWLMNEQQSKTSSLPLTIITMLFTTR